MTSQDSYRRGELYTCIHNYLFPYCDISNKEQIFEKKKGHETTQFTSPRENDPDYDYYFTN